MFHLCLKRKLVSVIRQIEGITELAASSFLYRHAGLLTQNELDVGKKKIYTYTVYITLGKPLW